MRADIIAHRFDGVVTAQDEKIKNEPKPERVNLVRLYINDFVEEFFHAVAAARGPRARVAQRRGYNFFFHAASTSVSRSGVRPACNFACRSGGSDLNQASVSRAVSASGRNVSPLLSARSIFARAIRCLCRSTRACQTTAALFAQSKNPRYPGKLRVRLQRGFDSVEHSADAEWFRRAGCIVNSGLAVLDHADRPFGEVAGINELHGVVRRTWREHFTAAIDPYRPVCKRSVSSRGPTISPGRMISVFPGNHFSASLSESALSGP